MPYTTPMTYTSGNQLTSAQMNTYVRDNVDWLASAKPRCKVKRAAALSPANATFTVVPFDTEYYDNGMHDNATNPSRLTIPAGGSGIYHIHMYVSWAANATGRRLMRLYKNGAYLLEYEVQTLSAAGVGTPMWTNWDEYLNAGDYIEMYLYQTSGGALAIDNVNAPATFGARWVGL